MAETVSKWDEVYKNVEPPWGLQPDRTLAEYARLVPPGRILDLGIGDGRNGLFFAQSGYEVEGFDISPTAVRRCHERAKTAKLNVRAEVGDVRTVVILRERYSLIIAAWVLNFFKKSEAEAIIGKMKWGLKKAGLVYSVVFSLDDPGYQRARETLAAVEEHTFYTPKFDSAVHYFTKEEILTAFDGLKVIYCAEGTKLDLEHSEPHYHGFIEYVGERR